MEFVEKNKGSDLIMDPQDLRDLDWTESAAFPGAGGCFLKAYAEEHGVPVYYKLSNYSSSDGVYGHESVNELIVCRLLDILKIPHLQYTLVHADLYIDGNRCQSWVAKSSNFRKKSEYKVPLDAYYEMERISSAESPADFVIRHGWEDYMYQMLAADYIIANRDRHGANIEVLYDQEEKSYRPAPIFDNGLSLLFSTYGNLEQAERFDPLQDIAANNFIGSRSLEKNLELIPKGYKAIPGTLQETDKQYIMDGLDKVLDQKFLDCIWNMIWKRWQKYEEICDKK